MDRNTNTKKKGEMSTAATLDGLREVLTTAFTVTILYGLLKAVQSPLGGRFGDAAGQLAETVVEMMESWEVALLGYLVAQFFVFLGPDNTFKIVQGAARSIGMAPFRALRAGRSAAFLSNASAQYGPIGLRDYRRAVDAEEAAFLRRVRARNRALLPVLEGWAIEDAGKGFGLDRTVYKLFANDGKVFRVPDVDGATQELLEEYRDLAIASDMHTLIMTRRHTLSEGMGEEEVKKAIASDVDFARQMLLLQSYTSDKEIATRGAAGDRLAEAWVALCSETTSTDALRGELKNLAPKNSNYRVQFPPTSALQDARISDAIRRTNLSRR